MITFCIPVASHHREVVARAIESVKSQTIPVKLIALEDRHQRGPGFIRNRLLEQVETEFVSFLDADDWIEPDFAKLTLTAMQAGHYVYTDWLQDDTVIKAPAKPWCGGTWHVVTTTLRTDDARAVGGFDETLTVMEDTDFYLKLVTNHICGIHVAEPLFHYGAGGQRSKTGRENGETAAVKKILYDRYAHLSGCCGDDMDYPEPKNQKEEAHDVLAQALWRGNRARVGLVSGRQYPRLSYPKTAWIDIRDVRAEPRVWRQVDVLKAVQPVRDEQGKKLNGLDGFTQALVQAGHLKQQPPRVSRGEWSPNIKRVVKIAKERL